MENIYKNAYFGKAYKTKDNTIVKFILQRGEDDFIIYIPKCKYSVETTHRYNSKGEFYLGDGEYGHGALDIVSEWKEEISKDEYEDKIKSLIDSCIYWEAYEDEPELFAKAFKELLDFAPSDKRTIDFCADMIKSRKTIFNEVNKTVTSFIYPKPKEINEEKLDNLAEKIFPYEFTTSLNASEEADYINELREVFKKGYRKALEQ